ncbi:phosphate ABC transporter substrate-binding protein [Gilvimarinus agarilyticus]|uniref:phosphate ABC transporter substrate-binding protein n=1 Tax=unclassified Gilvimarinus TaxID=2642066 RepID=UPI001C0902BB|nr:MULTISPECIES: phosphate ABC transporter substrate-binding protein [unclassified Gilvimarinus]MBU2885573.1 phosphate ABC transporter substrate-binding protein [Gilvimarinus agarilyticus]MDO6570440.1 phosphate ABC transporter substrate-binding protein [Gilvimarinus sp. 2_MG-2023]MDO6746492.1 phosphate ABC transporter substrate-binding protein [Gilvimarinus sp. 1_MG-2023]
MKYFLLTLLLASSAALAEVVVIVHPSGPDSMEKNQIRDLYIGRSKQLPGGQTADPIDLAQGQQLRDEFHTKVTGRSQAQLNAFWSKQVFTGKGQPPRMLDSSASVKAAVASTPGAIGYIEASEVDGSVKVTFTP